MKVEGSDGGTVNKKVGYECYDEDGPYRRVTV